MKTEYRYIMDNHGNLKQIKVDKITHNYCIWCAEYNCKTEKHIEKRQVNAKTMTAIEYKDFVQSIRDGSFYE